MMSLPLKTDNVPEALKPEPYVEGELRTTMPYEDPKFPVNALSGQKEKFLHYVASGMSARAAAVAVGAAAATGDTWLAKPEIKQALDHLRAKNRERLEFHIETAHTMYMDTYQVARDLGDPTAMKNTIDSLVKLHGIAKPAQAQVVNVTITNEKQALRLTDEQLLEQAGFALDYLKPEPRRRMLPAEDPIDAEFTEAPQGHARGPSPAAAKAESPSAADNIGYHDE